MDDYYKHLLESRENLRNSFNRVSDVQFEYVKIIS